MSRLQLLKLQREKASNLSEIEVPKKYANGMAATIANLTKIDKMKQQPARHSPVQQPARLRTSPQLQRSYSDIISYLLTKLLTKSYYEF